MRFAAPADLPPSLWERTKGYASDVEQIVDAPTYDLAAVLGVEFAWLSTVLLIGKAIAYGIKLEFFPSKPKRR